MAEVDESIDVEVPVSTAYNQWTQFEEFPQFMENVESVRQLDDAHLHWVAEVAGRRHEWDAEITYQDPDNHIAWRSIDGKTNSGSIRFEPLGEDRTRIKVRIQYEPEGVESVGSKLGVDDRGVRADLNRFKELVEGRGRETGAWRGEVRGGDVESS
ncbi:MAG: SRPBCC family protein [Actinomycetota bacterium]|nr:SRPBCC family protein [Actinomycetota bacterium]